MLIGADRVVENAEVALAVTGLGAAATVALIVRLVDTDPLALAFLAALVGIAVFLHPLILRPTRAE